MQKTIVGLLLILGVYGFANTASATRLVTTITATIESLSDDTSLLSVLDPVEIKFEYDDANTQAFSYYDDGSIDATLSGPTFIWASDAKFTLSDNLFNAISASSVSGDFQDTSLTWAYQFYYQTGYHSHVDNYALDFTDKNEQSTETDHGSLYIVLDQAYNGLNVVFTNINYDTVVAAPPIADAGPDQAVTLVNSLVILDASQSYDDNGDIFTVLWSVSSKPLGSTAVLSDPGSLNPEFTADVHGDYVFSLIATDIFGAESIPDSITVSFDNVAPVANAGTNQTGDIWESIYLDGTGSYDANNDSLTYSWSFVSKPTGSSTAFSDSSSLQPSFVADQPGIYVVSLVVDDGLVSATSNVEILIVENKVSVTDVLEDAIHAINDVDFGSFKNAKQKNVLTKKVSVVIDMFSAGLFGDALSKLENDVLKKTDGCTAGDAPDKNDWIKDCVGQQEVSPIIMDAIEMLRVL